MKKHIPFVALACLALAIVMSFGVLVRLGSKLFRVLVFAFAAMDRAIERVYYGIIARVDKTVNGKSHYAN